VEEHEKKQVRDEFRAVVNMAPKELEQWLGTEQSQSVGYTRAGDDEAVGHHSGRRIVAISGPGRTHCPMTTTRTCERSSATCTATVRSAQRAT
jgi:hypothetical protein